LEDKIITQVSSQLSSRFVHQRAEEPKNKSTPTSPALRDIQTRD
jgi:hypothetical protein